MRPNYPLVLLCYLITGCGSYHYIKTGESEYTELNKKLVNKKVVLKERTDIKMEANKVVINPDSTSIGERKIATENIQEITIEKGGTLKGLIYGVSTGFLFGGLAYLLQKDKAYIEMGLIILPPVGLVFGTLGGAIAGDDETYILISSQNENESHIRVDIISVLEQGSGYIVVLWKRREIRLERSDYSYRGTSADG